MFTKGKTPEAPPPPQMAPKPMTTDMALAPKRAGRPLGSVDHLR